MKRKISLERLYSLGDYKNIKFSEEVSEIPDELVNNEQFITILTNLMLLRIEQNYNKYIKLMESTRGKSIEDAISLIEDLKINQLDNLETFIKEQAEKKEN